MSSSSEANGLLIAAIGGEAAGDDGVALELVNRLPAKRRIARVSWGRIDPLDLAAELTAIEQPLLLVDAASMGLPPGSWRLLAHGQVRLGRMATSLSTHGVGVADGIELAAALGPLPPIWLFAVEPFDLTPGRGLSRPMRARMPLLTAALAHSADRLLAPRLARPA